MTPALAREPASVGVFHLRLATGGRGFGGHHGGSFKVRPSFGHGGSFGGGHHGGSFGGHHGGFSKHGKFGKFIIGFYIQNNTDILIFFRLNATRKTVSSVIKGFII